MRWVPVVLKAVAGTLLTLATAYGLCAGLIWIFDSRWGFALACSAIVLAIFLAWFGIAALKLYPDNNRTPDQEK